MKRDLIKRHNKTKCEPHTAVVVGNELVLLLLLLRISLFAFSLSAQKCICLETRQDWSDLSVIEKSREMIAAGFS